MKQDRKIQFFVNTKVVGRQIGTVHVALQEVDICNPLSLQQFLNNMIELGVIVPIEV
jgi:hypothetical protein